jgi:dyslexia susceptibility 1 candidate gene 1 protein
VDEQVAVPEVR